MNDGGLVDDILALKNGDIVAHVLENYDTSADYWKMLPDGTLVNDGDGYLRNTSGAYIDADGNVVDAENRIGALDETEGLRNIMYGNKDGYHLYEESNAYALATMASNLGEKVNMHTMMEVAGNSVANTVFERYYNHTVDTDIAKMVSADMGFDRLRPVHIDNRGRYNNLMNDRLTSYGPYGDSVQNALVDKYRQTIGDETTFRADENNPIVSDLMSQHDDAFSNPDSPTYLPGMGEGCNVMAVLSYPQMLGGDLFDAQAIKDIWGTAENDGWILGDGYVGNPDRLADIALERLKLDLRLEFGGTPDMQQIGNRLNIPNKHFLAGDSWGNVIFNPGNMVDNKYANVPVWAEYIERRWE